jgi:hypothetical protein
MNLIKYIYIVPVNTINNFREGVLFNAKSAIFIARQFILQWDEDDDDVHFV